MANMNNAEFFKGFLVTASNTCINIKSVYRYVLEVFVYISKCSFVCWGVIMQ